MDMIDIMLTQERFLETTDYAIHPNRCYLTQEDYAALVTDLVDGRIYDMQVTVIDTGESHLAYDPFLEN